MPRKKRDPDTPKRPLSSYMFYSKERRPKLQEEQPTLRFGEYSKVIAQEWKALTDEERVVFQERSATDKERYDEQMKEYKQKQKDKPPPPVPAQYPKQVNPLGLSMGYNASAVLPPYTSTAASQLQHLNAAAAGSAPAYPMAMTDQARQAAYLNYYQQQGQPYYPVQGYYNPTTYGQAYHQQAQAQAQAAYQNQVRQNYALYQSYQQSGNLINNEDVRNLTTQQNVERHMMQNNLKYVQPPNLHANQGPGQSPSQGQEREVEGEKLDTLGNMYSGQEPVGEGGGGGDEDGGW